MVEGIDFTYLKTVSGGDEAFELNMIETLIAEIDEKMTTIQVKIAELDEEGVRLQAHSLKNLYALLGIEILKQNFLQMETGCQQMSKDSLEQSYFQCGEEWHSKKGTLYNVISSYKMRLS